MLGRRMLVALLPLALVAACSRFGSSDDRESSDDGGTESRGESGSTVSPDGDAPDAPSLVDGPTGDDAPSDGGVVTSRDAGFCDGGYVVFVSATPWNASGGVATADQICQSEGLAALGADTYRAWISDSSKPAIARIKSNGPWCLPDGTRVATNKVTLKTGSPTPKLEAKIAQTASGAPVPVGVLAWTGTSGTGAHTPGNDCNGWTGGGMGTYGEPEAYDTSLWTSYSIGGCAGVSYRVVCFADTP